MGIRRHKVLYNDSAAGNGTWIRLDSRYEHEPTRAVQGVVTSGDTISIEGTTLEAIDRVDLDSIITADDIQELGSFTENFTDVLNGNWTYVRAVKTGTTGIAKIQGYI